MINSDKVKIIDYKPRHKEAFLQLNIDWIEEYFKVEELDRRLLSDPEGLILDTGGAILIAEAANEVLGVCALLYEAPGRYELTKMAIHRDRRGQGIGKQLLLSVISKAREIGVKELYLLSNTKLGPAIHLYRQCGFAEVPIPATMKYERVNIAMEMQLENQ